MQPFKIIKDGGCLVLSTGQLSISMINVMPYNFLLHNYFVPELFENRLTNTLRLLKSKTQMIQWTKTVAFWPWPLCAILTCCHKTLCKQGSLSRPERIRTWGRVCFPLIHHSDAYSSIYWLVSKCFTQLNLSLGLLERVIHFNPSNLFAVMTSETGIAWKLALYIAGDNLKLP